MNSKWILVLGLAGAGIATVLISTKSQAFQTHQTLLRKYLRLKKPKRILEWGPGFSTKVMMQEASNAQIYSVENNESWAKEWKREFSNFSNVHLTTLSIEKGYFEVPLEWGKFDLIFVDGAEPRGRSLKTAFKVLADDGVVILHDKEFPQNKDGMELFKVIEEDKHTVVMAKR